MKKLNFIGRINAFWVIERLEKRNILVGQNTESVNELWNSGLTHGAVNSPIACNNLCSRAVKKNLNYFYLTLNDKLCKQKFQPF